VDPGTIVDDILRFFEERIATLTAAGIARERLVLDPGMGLFLGRQSAASLIVLRKLQRLSDAFGLPVLVSTSRKSFIGVVLGGPDRPLPVQRRGAGTLATELWAIRHGAAYIRTHDVRALRDALRITAAIEAAGPAANRRP
jgi:dihydropteroate synthase type 2